ncbi:MAG: hypothetical protein COB67_10815 [SAR324 cluster bacterium]|uniref:Carrier domain-containing protein n=1 Tax=SAR324 cluster bacterium TaxID=2024889 RepID=A0A2A4SW17_9DELT|nr:MAG: hypothetical protein COB67_10815 [SAR324 cluster bacterium]
MDIEKLKTEIFEEMKDLIFNFMGIDKSEIRLKSRLYEDFGIESADMLTVVAAIEKKHQFKFDDTIWEVQSIEDALNVWIRHLQQ